MKRISAILLALGLAAGVRAGVWNTATPLNTDPISQGDDRIREMKTALQEALRGGDAEGVEAVFPGDSPLTAPIYRYRGLKGSTAARPSASQGGLYYNSQTGTIQRSSYTASDTGGGWEDITENAAYEAIHQKAPASLASAAGVVTVPETGNSFNVSGTEAVTSVAGWSAGRVLLKWNSARIITHGASLALKNSLSRNVVAGDVSEFEFTAANTVREIGFHGAGDGADVGEVKAFAGTTAPAGFLECNGASLLRTDYPALFAVIGSSHGAADGTHFNIPDLRGKFTRGWDHGAGNDPDASARTAPTGGSPGNMVGSLQADAFKSHTHGQTIRQGDADAPAGGSQYTVAVGGANTDTTGGNETRPVNVSLMYIIKY